MPSRLPLSFGVRCGGRFLVDPLSSFRGFVHGNGQVTAELDEIARATRWPTCKQRMATIGRRVSLKPSRRRANILYDREVNTSIKKGTKAKPAPTLLSLV